MREKPHFPCNLFHGGNLLHPTFPNSCPKGVESLLSFILIQMLPLRAIHLFQTIVISILLSFVMPSGNSVIFPPLVFPLSGALPGVMLQFENGGLLPSFLRCWFSHFIPPGLNSPLFSQKSLFLPPTNVLMFNCRKIPSTSFTSFPHSKFLFSTAKYPTRWHHRVWMIFPPFPKTPFPLFFFYPFVVETIVKVRVYVELFSSSCPLSSF